MAIASANDFFMVVELSDLKFLPVLKQIAVWLVSKTSFVNGNLLIKSVHKDLNNFGELLAIKIIPTTMRL